MIYENNFAKIFYFSITKSIKQHTARYEYSRLGCLLDLGFALILQYFISFVIQPISLYTIGSILCSIFVALRKITIRFGLYQEI